MLNSMLNMALNVETSKKIKANDNDYQQSSIVGYKSD